MGTTEYRNVQVETGPPSGGLLIAGEHNRYGSWMKFTACWALDQIADAIDVSDEAFSAIWALQDGYGIAGYEPAQGYDWSGIRDSTPEAVEAMWKVARQFLPDEVWVRKFGHVTRVPCGTLGVSL